MSDPQNDPLIDQIAELYQAFQKTLGTISHEHLEASKDAMTNIDRAFQDALREKIKGE